MKKILIITDYFYPHWTGISKSIYYLIKTKLKNIKFDVITVNHTNKLKNEEKIFNSIIYREPYIFSISRAKYSISIIFKFIKVIKNYDQVLINSPCANILFFSIIAKIFKKKLIIFHQGDLILPKGIFNKIIEKIFDISSLISFHLANKISTYTKDYAIHSRVMNFFLKKFTPIMMPIYIKKEKLSEKSNVYKKLINFKKNKKILFGFAGRFVEEKGFDILFDAINHVVKKNKNLHFIFAGETNIEYEKFFQKNLEKYKKIKKHLTLLGLLNEKELSCFYQLIDFIIIPSRSDCFPLVQAEAMLFNKPAIVSNIPGASYLVKKTKFGLIFEKGNHKELAEKIIIAFKIRNKILKNFIKVLKILDNKENVKKIKRFFTS
mgnify:CR=1 FL=1